MSCLLSFPAMSNQIVKPRVAIVTGAAQGIGHSIALRLSQDGFLVVVNDVPSKQELLDHAVKAMGGEGKALAAVGDAANAKHVQELVDLAVSKFGGLHVVSILILNALWPSNARIVCCQCGHQFPTIHNRK